jgi:hypothetical protein
MVLPIVRDYEEYDAGRKCSSPGNIRTLAAEEENEMSRNTSPHCNYLASSHYNRRAGRPCFRSDRVCQPRQPMTALRLSNLP